jgi:hypothetical protein
MYQYNPNSQNDYQYVPNNEGFSTPQPQQGQSQELSFQQFEYSQNNNNTLTSNAPSTDNYQHSYSAGTRGHDLPNGVTWKSVKRAFSTGGFDDEPPLLEGIFISR